VSIYWLQSTPINSSISNETKPEDATETVSETLTRKHLSLSRNPNPTMATGLKSFNTFILQTTASFYFIIVLIYIKFPELSGRCYKTL
jgi:hypothetical protein